MLVCFHFGYRLPADRLASGIHSYLKRATKQPYSSFSLFSSLSPPHLFPLPTRSVSQALPFTLPLARSSSFRSPTSRAAVVSAVTEVKSSDFSLTWHWHCREKGSEKRCSRSCFKTLIPKQDRYRWCCWNLASVKHRRDCAGSVACSQLASHRSNEKYSFQSKHNVLYFNVEFFSPTCVSDLTTLFLYYSDTFRIKNRPRYYLCQYVFCYPAVCSMWNLSVTHFSHSGSTVDWCLKPEHRIITTA